MINLSLAERGPRSPINNPADDRAHNWGTQYESALATELERLMAMKADQFIGNYVADPVEALVTLFHLLRKNDTAGARASVESMINRVAQSKASEYADFYASEA